MERFSSFFPGKLRFEDVGMSAICREYCAAHLASGLSMRSEKYGNK
jgi:hypothetical protein